jgi:hypothetical protein
MSSCETYISGYQEVNENSNFSEILKNSTFVLMMRKKCLKSGDELQKIANYGSVTIPESNRHEIILRKLYRIVIHISWH